MAKINLYKILWEKGNHSWFESEELATTKTIAIKKSRRNSLRPMQGTKPFVVIVVKDYKGWQKANFPRTNSKGEWK